MANRRDFFRSFTKPLRQTKEESPLLVRPPYGKDESLFQSECPSCESKSCVASCDEKIIFIADDGTPTLTFKENGCTFCDACAEVCETGVLSLENEGTADWLNAVFKISLEACVAHQGVICHACKEPCIDDAILFNGMFNPVIDDEKCTACGFCMSRCPTQAISYEVFELKQEVDQTEV
ncbi:nitrate reductase [Sulfurovum lithotrophicum]|uniref:Nitrate reductase n=1 Tax=Sulfurovum lithotrophicum TaxID=206403 RepID=A0A7U4M2G9_9BACT|nr:nitrate reductase [Sulfurovum lithotrophicum]